MKISLKKTLLAALAALACTASTAAASENLTAQHITSYKVAAEQIQRIADAEPLWKDEFVARWDAGTAPHPYLLSYDPSRTYFAVTDLDGNGRLELLFRHAAAPPETAAARPASLTHLSSGYAMSVYEIDADGRLAPLPVDEDGYGVPDLTELYALHQVSNDGARSYNTRTRILSAGDDGRDHYTIAYQQIILKDGRVSVRLLAEENGYYRVEGSRLEEVPTYAILYDGDPAHGEMRLADFQKTGFYRDFDRIYLPSSSVRWMSGDALNRDPRTAFTASWTSFSYGLVDGRG